MDFIVLYKALIRKKWIILGVTFFAILLALFITRNYQNVYKSTTQIATGFTIAEEVSVTNERFNLFEADVKFNNLIQTINSPIVFSLLSYNLILHDLDESQNSFRSPKKLEEFNDILVQINKEEVIEYFKMKLDSMELLSTYHPMDIQVLKILKQYNYDPGSLRDFITVSRIRGTDYINIETYTEDPYLSAFIVNTLTQEFLNYNRSLRTKKSFESSMNFANIVEQKRIEMEQKAEEYRSFKATNRVLNFDIESSNIIAQISELENKRSEEQRKIQNLSVEIDEIDNRISTQSQSTVTERSNAINSEIIQLKQQITDLNHRYVASGSNNILLFDSLQVLRSVLQEKLLQSNTGNLSNPEISELIARRQNKEIEHLVARKNLTSINENLRILKGNAGGYASLEAKIESLERELNIATQEYRDAQERYNTSLDIAMDSGQNIKQVLQGQPAEQPQPSKKLVITGLSGISSFLICVIIFVFVEYIDISVKTPSSFKRLSGTKQLGVIISLNRGRAELIEKILKNTKGKKFIKYTENIRKLRYEIESSNKKTFLITSTIKAQGKSTIILALAIALSKINKKVLIIDANFSDNKLTKVLQAQPVLEKISQFQDNSIKLLTKTNLKNLTIVGCQGGNYSPSEIISSEKLQKLINDYSNLFDYIFIEGAALNDFADSKELEPYVECVVAVFSAKSIIRQSDIESFSYLKSLTNKFLGTVLNDVEDYNFDQ